jgi:hypothetical protein
MKAGLVEKPGTLVIAERDVPIITRDDEMIRR